MPKSHTHPYQSAVGLLLLALALPAWWWAIQPGQPRVVDTALFLHFHVIVELFAIVVAALVFVTGYRAVLSARNGAVVLLGVCFLGVALLDVLHTLSYVGMADLVSSNSSQKSIFFWLCARFLAALGILVFALLPLAPEVSLFRKRLALTLVIGGVLVVAYVGLVWPDQVPALFVAGRGQTALKISLEWVVISIHLATLGVFWQRQTLLANECLMALVLAVALSAVSESFFTMGDVIDKDVANVMGHCYKLAAYLYLFHATVNEALIRPLQQLSMQRLREQQVLNVAPDGILWVDQDGQIQMTNAAIETLSGYAAHELMGQNVDIFLPPYLRARHGDIMREFFCNPQARGMGSMDLKLTRRDGSFVSVDISLGYWADPQTDERFAVAYIRDLTERKGFEESLQHNATHDQLTGLPNRWMFTTQLNQILAQARRRDRHVAVLMLDLDDFKNINDSFGHDLGDAFLVRVAHCLRTTLRANDTLARLGGDEFAIVIGDMQSTDEAIRVAEKLILTMRASFMLEDQELLASVSIGLAFYPVDSQDGADLMRYADMAMFQAKRSAKGTYSCYSKKLELRARENMQLHVRLKEALGAGHLRLYYQPKMDASGRNIRGAEALLRWHHADMGDISPARFIPVAESTGLILPISAWVLETACQQIAAWHQTGTPLQVAVNFSAQQFRHGKVAEQVCAALKRTGAPAHLLEIEITESIAMEQPDAAHEQLGALVALGCKVALDDFGTGYSSLAYLKSLPVSVLKIDRTFIKDIPGDHSDMKICRAIIALAHSLDMTLVAEGVETDAQLAFLRSYGCETYQGWLFAKAMPAADLTARLREDLQHDLRLASLAI